MSFSSGERSLIEGIIVSAMEKKVVHWSALKTSPGGRDGRVEVRGASIDTMID